jgi:hypothetical protein
MNYRILVAICFSLTFFYLSYGAEYIGLSGDLGVRVYVSDPDVTIMQSDFGIRGASASMTGATIKIVSSFTHDVRAYFDPNARVITSPHLFTITMKISKNVLKKLKLEASDLCLCVNIPQGTSSESYAIKLEKKTFSSEYIGTIEIRFTRKNREANFPFFYEIKKADGEVIAKSRTGSITLSVDPFIKIDRKVIEFGKLRFSNSGEIGCDDQYLKFEHLIFDKDYSCTIDSKNDFQLKSAGSSKQGIKYKINGMKLKQTTALEGSNSENLTFSIDQGQNASNFPPGRYTDTLSFTLSTK